MNGKAGSSAIRGSSWPPSRHCSPIGVVLLAELTVERRLLVPADEDDEGCGDKSRVPDELDLAEKQGLTDDRAHDGEVHRIADVPVEAADDEPLRGRDGRWCSNPFDDEPRERMQEDADRAREDHSSGEPERTPKRLVDLPACKQPRDHAGHDARG